MELVHNMSAGVVMNGLNLVLRNLQREQSGSYTCTAANNEGRVTSNAVLLSVRHVPVCAGARQEKTQGAARGSTAAVKCVVEAEPSHGIRWTWYRKRVDGSEEEIPEEDVRSDGLSSSVLVTPHTPEDYGRFLCLAANDVGSQETACVVTLVPAGPPDTPTNCSVNPIKDIALPDTATLAINCLEGFDGGLPQKFFMEAWQEGVLKANMTSDFPEWVVKDLQTGVSVSVKVAAYNARGRSEGRTMEVHTTSAQHHAAPGFLTPDTEAPIDIPPLVGAALGLVAVLLLLLVVGVVLCRRMRPRPRKPTAAEVPLTPGVGVDGFDPDVVASIQRPRPGLDVIPSDQEDDRDYEDSYEHERFNTDDDEDMLQAHATRHSCVHVHRTGGAGSSEQVGQGMYARGEGGPCSCVHSRGSRTSQDVAVPEHSRDGQGAPNNDSQSYDSGVSESESDSELQVMAGSNVAAVVRQYPDSGRSYVTLSPGEALAHVTPDAEVHLLPMSHVGVGSRPPSSLDVQSANPSPMEVRLKPFVSKEYQVSSDDAEGLLLLPSSCREVRLVPSSVAESRLTKGSPSEPRVPSSFGEMNVREASRRSSRPPSSCAIRSPTSQAEVICLPISPAESSSSRLLSERRSREATPKAAKKPRPSSSRDAQVHPGAWVHSEHDVGHPMTQDQLDLGRTVTLLHGEQGEVVFIPRKSPQGVESRRSSRQCTPVLQNVKLCDAAPSPLPDTLPKAVAKESKAKALKRLREMEKLDQTINTSPALPFAPQVVPDSQTKLSPAVRRSYQPRPNPDVCRRESSV
ncbi:uncharacterized protein LOC135108508 [Scylla paramamosain]|uniref:uncharacterized protein LOC135108508 n=1 Tax=Scylla paramamosain TaxID=85552 RepID=UPI0030830902